MPGLCLFYQPASRSAGSSAGTATATAPSPSSACKKPARRRSTSTCRPTWLRQGRILQAGGRGLAQAPSQGPAAIRARDPASPARLRLSPLGRSAVCRDPAGRRQRNSSIGSRMSAACAWPTACSPPSARLWSGTKSRRRQLHVADRQGHEAGQAAAGKQRSRDRILNDDEIRALWGALDEIDQTFAAIVSCAC